MNKKEYPLSASASLWQKILVFLPVGVLTLSTLAMNTSLKNLMSPRVEEIGLGTFYAILSTVLGVCSTIAGPIGGKISDTIGRKKTAIIGTGIFALGSLMVGTGTTLSFLMIGFILTGLAFGMVNPLSSSMIADVMDKGDVPAFIGYAQGLMSLGSILIPFLTGWLAEKFTPGVGIRSLLVFAVISLLAVFLLYPDIKTESSGKYEKFDWVGLTLMALCIGPLSIALTLAGKSFGWFSAWSFLLFGIAILCGVLFVRHIRKAENALIDVSMFQVKGFPQAILLGLFSMPTVTLIGGYLIRYAQMELGFSAAVTGAWSARRIVPIILSPVIGTWLAKSVNKNKSYKFALVFGGIVNIVAVALILFSVRPGAPSGLIFASLCLFQGGAAFENSPLKALIASSMPANMRGSGLAIQEYSNSCMSSLYGAVCGLIYNSMAFPQAITVMIAIALGSLVIREIIAITKIHDLNVG